MEKMLKETRPGLLRERARLLKKLSVLDPVLASELTTVILKLDVPEQMVGEYAHFPVTRPLDAVIAYLQKTGEWADPKTIARSLLDGGFPLDPARGVGYLTETIRYRAKAGKLQRAGSLVGLIEWEPPTT